MSCVFSAASKARDNYEYSKSIDTSGSFYTSENGSDREICKSCEVSEPCDASEFE